MNPYLAYTLGVLTVIVMWLIFYLASTLNVEIYNLYSDLVCPTPPEN